MVKRSTQNLNKTNKIYLILPILWDSYVHIYEARNNRIQNSINFLIVVVSFLPIICLTLFQIYKSNLYLFPIIPQLIALLILFKSFFIKQMIPWLKYDEIIKNLDSNLIHTHLLSILKSAENETWLHLKILRKIIISSLLLIVLSIYLIIFSFIYNISKGRQSVCCMTVALIILLSLTIIYYIIKPNSNFDNDYNKFYIDINQWLNR